MKVLVILLLLTTAARADTYTEEGTYISDATTDNGWLDVGLDGDEPVTDTEIYDDAEE